MLFSFMLHFGFLVHKFPFSRWFNSSYISFGVFFLKYKISVVGEEVRKSRYTSIFHVFSILVVVLTPWRDIFWLVTRFSSQREINKEPKRLIFTASLIWPKPCFTWFNLFVYKHKHTHSNLPPTLSKENLPSFLTPTLPQSSHRKCLETSPFPAITIFI